MYNLIRQISKFSGQFLVETTENRIREKGRGKKRQNTKKAVCTLENMKYIFKAVKASYRLIKII